MSFVGIAGKYQKFYTAIALKAKMSSSVFLEGAVTTADKAVDGDWWQAWQEIKTAQQ